MTDSEIEKIEPKKERVYFLDALKTLAIFMVCFYHYNNLQTDFIFQESFFSYFNYFIQGACAICVPLFFMINGYLYLNSEIDIKKHSRKTFKLFFLSFFWSALLVLTVGSMLGHKYNLLEFISSTYFFETDVSDHLWFLQTLFCIYLFFPIIKASYDKENKSLFYWFMAVVFFMTIFGDFLNNILNVIRMAVGFNTLPEHSYFLKGFNPFLGFKAYSLIYFFVGALLKKIIDEKQKYIEWFYSKLLLIGVFILMGISFLYGVLISNFKILIYDNVWYGFGSLTALLMSTFVFLLFSNINYENQKINNFIKLIGSNTLGIYLLHRISGVMFIDYFKKLPGSDNLIMNIFWGAFITLFSLGLVLILKKIPFIKNTLKL